MPRGNPGRLKHNLTGMTFGRLKSRERVATCFSVVPKPGAIAAIGCEIIELHSHGTVGVEPQV
jgi:hypothetical protein